MKPLRSRGFAALTVAAVCVVAAGCAGDLNPVRDVFVATGVAEGPREAPEFIEASRRPDPGFLPIGQEPAARSTDPKSAEEIAAMEEELRRVRDRNAASAAAARDLAGAPAPEPVVVTPPPPLEPTPTAPRI